MLTIVFIFILRIKFESMLSWQQWFCPAFHFGNTMAQHGPNASYPVQSASTPHYFLLRLQHTAVLTSSDATSHVQNRDATRHNDHRMANVVWEDFAKHAGTQRTTCIIYTWNIDPCKSKNRTSMNMTVRWHVSTNSTKATLPQTNDNGMSRNELQ